MRFDLADEGTMLATRERGREVRQRLEDSARSLEAGDVLIVDCNRIAAMTVSFADECFGKLVADRASSAGETGLLVANTSEDLRETLEVVMSRRKLALANVRDDGGLDLLGAQWLRDTMIAVEGMGTFRANDLADQLHLTAPAANNRLRTLLLAGAVVRERSVPDRGGKEFIYRVALAVPVS